MSIKLEKLGAEREKARQKMESAIARFKELDRKYKELENSETLNIVHDYCLTPDQLIAFLEKFKKTGDMNIKLSDLGENAIDEYCDGALEIDDPTEMEGVEDFMDLEIPENREAVEGSDASEYLEEEGSGDSDASRNPELTENPEDSGNPDGRVAFNKEGNNDWDD